MANVFQPAAGETTERRTIRIAMNGVTGRMGTNQHLVRSILAIREQGGIAVGPGEHLWPAPTLVGRDERKLAALAEPHALEYTTDVATALADCDVYFDAQITSRREASVPRRSRRGGTCTARSR